MRRLLIWLVGRWHDELCVCDLLDDCEDGVA